MAVKIRLKRMGKIRAPFYRVVVMDSRKKRDGRAIEEIGKYHPTAEPSLIEIDSERAQYWLSVGAQPSEQVAKLLKLTGDWHKFKNIQGPKTELKVKDADKDAAKAEAIAAVETDAEKKKAAAAAEAEAQQAEAAKAESASDDAAEAGAAEAGAEETADAATEES